MVRRDLEKLSFNMSGSVLVFLTLSKVALLLKKIDVVEKMIDKVQNNLYVKTILNTPMKRKIYQQRASFLFNLTRFLYALMFIAYPLRIAADTALETKSYLIPIPYRHKLEDYYFYMYGIEAVISTHFLVTVISHDMFVYGIIIRYIEHLDILEENIFKIKTLYPKRNFEEFVPGYQESDDQKDIVEDVLMLKTKNPEKMKIISENYELDTYNRTNWIKKREFREQRTSKILRENIYHHQKLLKEVRQLADLYSLPLLIQAWGFVTLIGIAIVQVIILSRKVTFLLVQQALYVGTSLTNLLCLCTFGSELSAKSWAAADALYDIPWYEMNKSNQKTLLFMMRKLIMVPKLKAGGLVNINRVTYLKFLQTSYNLVAVMRNIY